MGAATHRTTATQHVEKWTWPPIFVGIVLLALGLAVRRGDVVLGWGIAATGILLIVVGIVLIGVRSRMYDPAHDPAHRAKKTP